MKKKFGILFIVFALTLSACANDSSKEDEHGHAEQESSDNCHLVDSPIETRSDIFVTSYMVWNSKLVYAHWEYD